MAYDLLIAYLRYRSRKTSSYIFVVTTGRSGTGSLAKILGEGRAVKAEHEALPNLANRPLSDRSMGRSLRALQAWDKKVVSIYQDSRGSSIYCDTSHVLGKSFLPDIVREFRERLKVVHLIRDPVSVAGSLFRINAIPGQSQRFLIDFRAPTNILQLQEHLNGSDREAKLFRLFWYFYETELRIARLKVLYADIPFIVVFTKELSDERRLDSLFRQLDIPIERQRLKALSEVKENLKSNRKEINNIELTKVELEDSLEKFLGLCNSLGHDLRSTHPYVTQSAALKR